MENHAQGHERSMDRDAAVSSAVFCFQHAIIGFGFNMSFVAALGNTLAYASSVYILAIFHPIGIAWLVAIVVLSIVTISQYR